MDTPTTTPAAAEAPRRVPMALRTRPWTPTRREDGSAWIAVKRCCNGCEVRLGDATEAEVLAVSAGELLPDTRGECPFCSRRAPRVG